MQRPSLELGREYYAAREFKLALRCFSTAMRSCVCYRGTKRHKCSCKDFEAAVAREGGSIFAEAMYTCHCDVGKTFNKCDRSEHLSALSYRVATFEAMGNLTHARSDAEWLLEIAPRALLGYLRLGKVARLQGKHEFAWHVYNAGIEVASASQNADADALATLHVARSRLKLRFGRRDPLDLPYDVARSIFLPLDLVTRVRCIRVSKKWRSILTSPAWADLWRKLHFPSRLRSGVLMADLVNLIRYAQSEPHEVVILNAMGMGLGPEKLGLMLRHGRRLEALKICRMPDQLTLGNQIPNLNRLRRLALLDWYHELPGQDRFGIQLLSLCAGSIEDLRIQKALHISALPALPKLKYLSLSGIAGSDFLRSLPSLNTTAPDLEQLKLEVSEHFQVLETIEWPDEALSKLQVLIFQCDGITGTHVAASNLISHIKGRQLKHLEIRINGRTSSDIAARLYSTLGSDIEPENHNSKGLGIYDDWFCNIRYFHCEGLLIDPLTARALLDLACDTGKLHTYGMGFPLFDPYMPEGQECTTYLGRYDWLRGSTSIRTLILSGFRFKQFARDDADQPLLVFLQSFPNLTTLDIQTEEYTSGELYTLLSDILRVTDLKALHIGMTGVLLQGLLEKAEAKGVTIYHSRVSAGWPVALGD